MLGALAERLDEVEALDAAGAPLPHPALDADHQRGPVEAFDDAGGDDADDAGVPSLGPEDEAAGALPVLGLGDGLDEHLALDLLAILVGVVELGGERAGLGQVPGPEQLEADRGVIEASGGVDPWPESEAHLSGAHRALGLQSGNLLEGPDAGATGPGQRVEAMLHEDAVGAGERDDVAHRGERDEVHQRLQRGLGTALEPPEGAERAPERHDQVERDAGRAEDLGGVLAARAGAD